MVHCKVQNCPWAVASVDATICIMVGVTDTASSTGMMGVHNGFDECYAWARPVPYSPSARTSNNSR